MKFWKKKFSSKSGETSETREFVAESLEPRILFSGAPVDAEIPDISVSEAEESQQQFESLGDFGSGVVESAENLEEEGSSEVVVLANLNHLSPAEIEDLAKDAVDYWKNKGDLTDDQRSALNSLEVSLVDIVSLAEGGYEFELSSDDEGVFSDSVTFGESTSIYPESNEQFGVDLIIDLLQEVGDPKILDQLAGGLIAARTIEVGNEDQPVTYSTLDLIAEAAEHAWVRSGLTADQLAALESIDYQIVELEGAALGYAEGSTVFIDDDGAGRGWYYDSTPYELSETGFDGIDLVSVLSHEIGHVLGLDHSDEVDDIMDETFAEGERRIVSQNQAQGATPGSLEGAHFAMVDEVLLSTDFTGRTVSGTTASNITWTVKGIQDPGDLTVTENDAYGNGIQLTSFHDTDDASGHFAPDLNIHNEGEWEVSIPIVLTESGVTLTRAVLDVQAFNNSGSKQNNDMDFTLEIVGSISGSLLTQSVNNTGVAGAVSFNFSSPLSLSDAETYELKITSIGQGAGNNSGLDAISVYGTVTGENYAPELANVQITSEDEGSQTTLSGRVNDGDFIGDGYTVVVDWGDPNDAGVKSYNLANLQPEEGTYNDVSGDFTLFYTYADDSPGGDATNTYSVSVQVWETLAYQLQALYTFDGGDASDATANSNHSSGVVGTGISYVADTRSGDGMAVSGSGTGYIVVPHSQSLNEIDDQLTVAFWIKAEAGENNDWFRLMRKGDASNNDSPTWIINRNDSTGELLFRTDTVVADGGAHNQNRHHNTGENILDGAWHHVTYVLDSGSTKEYIDGVLNSTTTYVHGSGLGNTNDLQLLGRSSSDAIDGLMDDIGIWSRALTDAEVAQLHNGDPIPTENVFSEIVTVTTTVSNVAPELAEGEGNVDETNAELTASGTLTVSDSGILDAIQLTVSSVSVSGQTNGIVNGTLLAMLNVDSDPVTLDNNGTGSVNWQFNSDGEAFDYLGDVEELVLTYTVLATDDDTGSGSNTLTITIGGTNDSPVAHSDTDSAVEAGGASNSVPAVNAEGNVITGEGGTTPGGTDLDADVNDVLQVLTIAYSGTGTVLGGQVGGSVSVETKVDGRYGTLTISPDGTYRYEPNQDATDFLDSGETVTEEFTYRLIEDSKSGTFYPSDLDHVRQAGMFYTRYFDTNVNPAAGGSGLITLADNLNGNGDVYNSYTVTNFTTGYTPDVNFGPSNFGTEGPGGSVYPADFITNSFFTDTVGRVYIPNGTYQIATLSDNFDVVQIEGVTFQDAFGGASDGSYRPPAPSGDIFFGSGTYNQYGGASFVVDDPNGGIITNLRALFSEHSGDEHFELLIRDNAAGDGPVADQLNVNSLIDGGSEPINGWANLTDGALGWRVEPSISEATLTITVQGANDDPTEVDDSFTGVTEDDANAVVGNLLDNDSDPDTDDVLTVISAGGRAVGNQTELDSGALITVAADGSFEYDPNGAFESLAAGESITDSFSYNVSDGDSPVLSEVNGIIVADALDFSNRTDNGNDIWQLIEEGDEVANNIGGNPQTGSRYGTFLQVTPDDGGGIQTPNQSAGSFRPTGEPGVEYTIQVSESGTYQLFVRASGSNGAGDSLYASILELQDGDDDNGGTGVNPDWYRINSNSNEFRWLGVGGPEETGQAFNVPVVFDLDPGTYTVRFTPREDGVSVDGFALLNLDNASAAAIAATLHNSADPLLETFPSQTHATASVVVQGVNDAPEAADQTRTIQEDEVYTFSGDQVDADFLFDDVDASDTLYSVTIETLPGSGTLTLDGVDITAGQEILFADLADFSFTPDQDEYGSPYTSFTFHVNDGNGGSSDTKTFTFDVLPVADPPVANPDAVTAVEEGGADAATLGVNPQGNVITGNILTSGNPGDLGAADTEVDGDVLKVVRVTFDGTPFAGATQFGGAVSASGLTFIDGAYGTLEIDVDGNYTYRVNNDVADPLDPDDRPSDVFTYTIVDRSDLLAYYTFEAPDNTSDGEASDLSGKGFGDGVLTGAGASGFGYDSDNSAVGDQSLLLTESGSASWGKLNPATAETGQYDFNGEDWTLSGWYNRSDTATHDFIFYLGDSDGFSGGYDLYLYGEQGSNHLKLLGYDDNVSSVNKTVVNAAGAGEWNHVSLVHDSSAETLFLYVNGVLSSTITDFTSSHNNELTIGGNANGTVNRRFNGNLDEIAVFSAVLDSDEISALAQKQPLSSSSTLTVTVQGTNDAPEANPDTDEATEAGGVGNTTVPAVNAEGNVLTGVGTTNGGTDTDVDSDDDPLVGDGSVIVVEAAYSGGGAPVGTNPGGAIVGETLVDGQYGTLTINPDGSYSYAPDATATDGLAAGESATDVFTYGIANTSPSEFAILDIEANGADTAAGALSISGFNPYASGNFSEQSFVSANGEAFTVAISPSGSGSIDWRDRKAGSGADSPVDLGEDFVKNSSGLIDVTLGSLPAGIYTVTSYHLDADYDQSGTIKVLVDNNGGGFVDTGETGNANIHAGGVGGLTSEELDATAVTFTFTADGTNDVIIRFDGSTDPEDTETPLNGLSLFYQPEVPAESQSTLTITVNGTNDAPEFTDGPDSATLPETNSGLTASGNLTVSDADTTDLVTGAVSLAVSGDDPADPSRPSDAELLAMFSVNPAAPGQWLSGSESTKTLNWEFDSGSEAFDYLPDGQSLVLTYTLTATDNATVPLSGTETVTITITGSNDAPVASPDTDIAVEAGGVGNTTVPAQPAVGNVISGEGTTNAGTDQDVDFGEAPANVFVTKVEYTGGGTPVGSNAGGIVHGETVVDGEYGTLTILADGSYTYTPNEDATDSLAAGESATDVFTYGSSNQEAQQILIDIQANGGRTADGAIGVEGGAHLSGNEGIFDQAYTTANGLTFRMSIDDTNASGNDVGSVDWRDRGDSTSTDELVKLAEDFVKNNGGIIRVTFSDLPAGSYEVTSYHADSQTTQSEAIQVLVDNGNGSGFVNTGQTGNANVSIGGNNALTTTNIESTAAHFTFVADGVNDVIILFDGSAAVATEENGNDKETPLNGLLLNFIPDVAPESEATLTVTINGANDEPVANNDTNTITETGGVNTSEAAATSGNVMGGTGASSGDNADTDVDSNDDPAAGDGSVEVVHVEYSGTGTPYQTANPGGSVNGATQVDGEYGTLTINPDGTYSYSLDDAAVDHLTAGETATEVFTYSISDHELRERFSQDFDAIPDGTSGTFSDGSSIEKNGGIFPLGTVQDGRLVLADDTQGNRQAVYRIPAQVNSSLGWEARLLMEFADAASETGNNSPADGVGFSYGALPTSGTFNEGGPGTGLNIKIDTYGPNDSNLQGYEIRLNNSLVARVDMDIFVSGETFDADVLVSWDPDRGVSLSINGEAIFTDVEVAGFVGDDSYTFAVSSRTGGADEDVFLDSVAIATGVPPGTATLTINVNGTNDAPIAVDDIGTYATDEDSAVTFSAVEGVLANDNDVDIDGTAPDDSFSVTAVQGSAGVGSPIHTAQGGIVTLNSDGSFTYNPNSRFDYLAFGESAVDTFTYTITDSEGLTDTATVTLTINGVDDAPVATDDGTLELVWQLGTNNGGTGEFEQEGGTNPAPGNPYRRDDDYYFAGEYGGSIGTVVEDESINDGIGGSSRVLGFERALLNGSDSTNRIHFNLEPGQLNDDFQFAVDFLSIGGQNPLVGVDVEILFNGNQVFAGSLTGATLVTTDLFNGSTVGAQTGDNVITIRRTDSNPGWITMDYLTLSAVEVLTTSEDATLTVDATEGVLSNDADPDTSDTLTVIDHDATSAAGATVAVNEDGSFTYNPTGQFDYLAAGESATDTFSYTMIDSGLSVIYTQDFDGFANGTTDLGDGSSMASNANASVQVQDGVLQLLEDGVNDQRGVFRIPAQNHSSLGWASTFTVNLEEEPGGGRAADGFSFSYGNIPASGTGGSQSGWGSANHIAFEFDFYEDTNQTKGYAISVNGSDVPGGYEDVLILGNGESKSLDVTVSWDPVTGAALMVDGVAIFTNLDTGGFSPQDDYTFAFAGATGGATAGVAIDDLKIYTHESYEAEITVTVTGVNDAPVTDVGNSAGNQTATEGATLTINDLIRFTDLDLTDFSSSASEDWRITVTWGDGTQSVLTKSGFTNTDLNGGDQVEENGTLSLAKLTTGEANLGSAAESTANIWSVSGSHTYFDDTPGPYTVNVVVDDGNGGSATHDFTVDVANVAPHASDDGWVEVWQVGIDNNTNSEFEQENGGTNASPGSATGRDDDWYFAGTYGGTIGTLAVDEVMNDGVGGTAVAGFERALTSGDRTNRIHFNLDAGILTNDFRITIDVVNSQVPDKGFMVEVLFNGTSIYTEAVYENGIITIDGIDGAAVGATTGENILTIRRLEGNGGWMTFDRITLETQSKEPLVELWRIGGDNGTHGDFAQESGASNAAPGSATVKDDDYYLAGSYPAPVGTVADHENEGLNFERALTIGDKENRIHFNLPQYREGGNFRVKVDVAPGSSIPAGGFDIEILLNGNVILSENVTRAGILTADAFDVVRDVDNDNVIEIRRTDNNGGWIAFDYVALEAMPDYATTEDGPVLSVSARDGVLANDFDPADPMGFNPNSPTNHNDPLTVTEIQGSGGLSGLSDLGGTVTMAADGSFTYDPTTSAYFQTMVSGEIVFDTFTYTISDGDGGTDTATVTVAVTGEGAVEIDMTKAFPVRFGANDPATVDPDTVGLAMNGGDLEIIVNEVVLRSVPGSAISNASGPHDIEFTGSAGAETLNIGSLGNDLFNDVSIGLSGNTDQVSFTGTSEIRGALDVTAAAIELSGSVTAGSSLDFHGPVDLTGAVTLSSDSAGDVTFHETVDGANSLVINTAGATTFTEAVGGNAALTSVSADAVGTLVINGGSVVTTGAQAFNESMTLGGDTVLRSTGGGSISLANIDGPHRLEVVTDGAVNLSGTLGGVTPLASLAVTAGANFDLLVDVITTGTVDLTTLSGNMTLGAAAIRAGGDVTLSADDNFTLDENGSITSSGGSIDIKADQVGVDDAAGSWVNLYGDVSAAAGQMVAIAGGSDSDVFNIVPSLNSKIKVDGGNPSFPVTAGDILNIIDGISPQRIDGAIPGSGIFTFGGGQKDVEFVDIERDSIPTLEIDIPISQRLFPTTVNGVFTDYGLGDSHTLTIDWKDPDGGVSTFAVPSFDGGLTVGMVITSSSDGMRLKVVSMDSATGEVKFAVSHTYQRDGLYDVVVTVTDSTDARVAASQVAEVYFLAPDENGTGGFFSFANLPGRFSLSGFSSIFNDLRLERLFATDFEGNDISSLSGLGETPLVEGFISLEGEVRVIFLDGGDRTPIDLLTALNQSILKGTPLDFSGNALPFDSQKVLQMITDLIQLNVDGVTE